MILRQCEKGYTLLGQMSLSAVGETLLVGHLLLICKIYLLRICRTRISELHLIYKREKLVYLEF